MPVLAAAYHFFCIVSCTEQGAEALVLTIGKSLKFTQPCKVKFGRVQLVQLGVVVLGYIFVSILEWVSLLSADQW